MNTARSRSPDFMQKACNFYIQQLPEMHKHSQHTTYQYNKNSYDFILLSIRIPDFQMFPARTSAADPAKRTTDGFDTRSVSNRPFPVAAA